MTIKNKKFYILGDWCSYWLLYAHKPDNTLISDTFFVPKESDKTDIRPEF